MEQSFLSLVLEKYMGWIVALGIYLNSERQKRKEKKKKPTLKIDFMKIQPRPDDKKFRWQQIVVKNTSSERIKLIAIVYHRRGQREWKRFPEFSSNPFHDLTIAPNRHSEAIWLFRPLLLNFITDWIAIKDSNENFYFIPQKDYLFLNFCKKYHLNKKKLPKECESFLEFIDSSNVEKNYCRFD